MWPVQFMANALKRISLFIARHDAVSAHTGRRYSRIFPRSADTLLRWEPAGFDSPRRFCQNAQLRRFPNGHLFSQKRRIFGLRYPLAGPPRYSHNGFGAFVREMRPRRKSEQPP